MTTDPDTNRIAALEAELASLRDELTSLRSAARPGRERSTRVTSRRNLLGAAAAAAAGATLASARPVAAADPNDITKGVINTTTQTTELTFPANLVSAPRSHVLVVQDGVWGAQVPNAGTDPEDPFRAAIAGYCGNDAIHGFYGQTNSSLLGGAGARFHGESAQSYGLVVSGRRATIRLRRPSGTQSAPPSRFDFHNDGEITLDTNNDLWVCVASGNPGSWRKLAGPAAAGSFHPISPVRVFDSRVAAIPSSGRFAAGSIRTVSVATAYNDAGGVVATDAVPAGATAVTFNVASVFADGPGFLAVAPGGTTSVATSTVNWTAADDVVANGGVVGLDATRGVALLCGPAGADVILDITGYYR